MKSFDIFESPGYTKIKPIKELLDKTPKDRWSSIELGATKQQK